MKNENGFTLIEMMVVLLIISVLLLITIPNISKSNSVIDDKGCEALKELVETQAQLFRVENGTYPLDIETLVTANYLDETQKTCPNGTTLTMSNGVVSDGSGS